MEPTVVPLPTQVRLLAKKVVIALPWYKSSNPMTSMCIAQLADSRRAGLMLNWGDAFIAHSRNSCADAFLRTNFEWVLFVDDDMIVPCGNAAFFNTNTGFNFPDNFAGLNAIDRLLSHGKTIVGALYFGRNSSNAPPVYCEGQQPKESEYARSAPIDVCKPTKWVGTGCMLVHRTVFEDIEKRFPRLRRGPDGKGGQWFTSTEASLVQQLEVLRDQLQEGPMDGNKAYKAMEGLEHVLAIARAENSLGMGEDVSFCIRARASGHTPHVDFGLVCGHVGSFVFGPRNMVLPGLKTL